MRNMENKIPVFVLILKNLNLKKFQKERKNK